MTNRADLFSFGVLLFEKLTVQRPFGGQYDAALSYAIVKEEPHKLSDVLPNTPERLSMLINRLLEKTPPNDIRVRRIWPVNSKTV